MSPLDMFAAQSRALARQLQDTQKNGRRVSRLPPLAVADGLAKKPGRLASHAEEPRPLGPQRELTDPTSAASSSGKQLEVEEPPVRPKSYYPRFSSIPVTKEEPAFYESPVSRDETFFTPMELAPKTDYFERQRAQSPESFSRPRTSVDRVSQASNSRSKSEPVLKFPIAPPSETYVCTEHTQYPIRGLGR